MQEYIDFFQQNLILFLIWLSLFFALIVHFLKSYNILYKEITTSEAVLLMNRENGIIIDIRSQDKFKKGHIINSVNILPLDLKKGNLGNLINYKSRPIIVVCETGNSSKESAHLLIKSKFKKVNVLKNGLIAWKEDNIPLISNNII
ncbi:hypothetical protein CF66_2104 [Candidatus Photodesmus katoptron]|uniref:rhodanese-like domain-containing protein n=1 Tax=Candidatus Photodesmus anomalopis TaxID=28176 RepID=UPI0004D87531|nr:rhodanese-like domain-containing protein [Candidatus Photodesmus katoptron]KEY90441.1 hypothetical protein CF66_2104 [Candidatus Photodesmus katoptron]